MLHDQIALDKHDYTATKAERIRNSKRWVLSINDEGPLLPRQQRPDYEAAIRECQRLQDKWRTACSEQGTRPAIGNVIGKRTSGTGDFHLDPARRICVITEKVEYRAWHTLTILCSQGRQKKLMEFERKMTSGLSHQREDHQLWIAQKASRRWTGGCTGESEELFIRITPDTSTCS